MTAANDKRRRATLSGLARMLSAEAEAGCNLSALAHLLTLLQDEFAAAVDEIAGPDPEPETKAAPEAPQPAPAPIAQPALPARPARKPRAPRARRAEPAATNMPPPPPPPVAAYAMLGG